MAKRGDGSPVSLLINGTINQKVIAAENMRECKRKSGIHQRLTDEEARVLVNEVLEGYELPEIKSMTKSLTDETVARV